MWSSSMVHLLIAAWLGLLVEASITTKGHGILKRQAPSGNSILNQVPEGCRTTCGPIDIILTQCNTTSCICTAANYVALKICMDCVVDFGTATPTYGEFRSQGQSVLSGFGSDCAQQGMRLSQILLNPSPAPGPPGNASATTVPNIIVRPTPSSGGDAGAPRVSGTGGDENGTASALSISLFSFAVTVVTGVVALL
ncbi:hypothetical protein D9756_009244 [Leucocoprinus leucothites]|uniref:Extracellular membrane protein CFEM domain-containing protein n=1 Tax=Leucocoprinus leucothites TaxID=201217 RepID=A0A8H5CXQ4_9AGAR|nr:hypothetical protein D9756_009244 [Leucoagaricus leucothites]